MPVGFFKFEYISHCQLQIRVVNPFLSHFLPSFFHGRSALLKSSGRTRRQRAGGLRRVSRSGCWRGWPWWPGSWWAHSSPRNACEGRSTTTFPTLFPDLPPSFPSTYTIRKLKWRSCLSRQNCWWCLLLFFFPSHILWWTKNPHMFNFWEKEREESPVFICSPSSTLMKTLWLYRDRHVILSSTEPIVPFNPFSTGSCIIFLSSCLYVLVLTNFDFSFSLSREAETDSSLHS